jgi:hypothetical protein
MKLKMAGLISTVAVATAISGCTVTVGGSSVNTDKAEMEIAEGIKTQTGMDVTVKCPADVEATAGGQFACTATTADGKSGTVMVLQKDDQGNISWELENSSDFTSGAGQGLDMPKVVDNIVTGLQSQTGVTATVNCPTTVPIEANTSFNCTATASDGDVATVKVTQTDDQGSVTWALEN